MITAKTIAETPRALRAHEEPTALDALAPFRSAAERWHHHRERDETAADLPSDHEPNAPRALL